MGFIIHYHIDIRSLWVAHNSLMGPFLYQTLTEFSVNVKARLMNILGPFKSVLPLDII